MPCWLVFELPVHFLVKAELRRVAGAEEIENDRRVVYRLIELILDHDFQSGFLTGSKGQGCR